MDRLSSDDRMMGEALAEAAAALQEGVFPVGAVLAKGTDILGRARKTMASNHLSHAEMNLFHKVFMGDYRFSRADGLTLYTTLEPCVMCFGTLLHLPIVRLVFAMEDAYGGCASVTLNGAPPRHAARPVAIAGGVRRDEARALFASFLDTTAEPFWREGGAPHFQTAVRGEPVEISGVVP
ncbi:nucleoside deaminase [Ancylobacter dichloromethanicus]|uniref:tRNA-specific adenosine deaminase n=1 Tax=Ancylobacter dichloromethanicus TaxID=518825 RepID=A0A9W6JCB9_9HYPH|nr:deaminase [Ancylobacter dichloromethanicus]MBS7553233.1 nucleoside deaminase [Ancylobacter dichloromethanicus]GLK73013.1 tRNA-specific adenosine deaminase [Ancylobacter dichloromethanicus]